MNTPVLFWISQEKSGPDYMSRFDERGCIVVLDEIHRLSPIGRRVSVIQL